MNKIELPIQDFRKKEKKFKRFSDTSYINTSDCTFRATKLLLIGKKFIKIKLGCQFKILRKKN